MIKPLRKRHWQTWWILAFLLPSGIVFSWLVIPTPAQVRLNFLQQPSPLPIIERTFEAPGFMVRLRSNRQRSLKQLEWTNKAVLKVPTATIYVSNQSSFNPSRAMLVGRIESRGNYLFSLDSPGLRDDTLHLVLYDFIHERIIDQIKL